MRSENMVVVHRFERQSILCRGVTRTLVLVVAAMTSLAPSRAHAQARTTLNFNPDWKFIKEDPQGASAPDFNDSKWTTVSAPHTYNDIDTFDDFSINGHKG